MARTIPSARRRIAPYSGIRSNSKASAASFSAGVRSNASKCVVMALAISSGDGSCRRSSGGFSTGNDRRGRTRPGRVMVEVWPDNWTEYSDAPKAVARMQAAARPRDGLAAALVEASTRAGYPDPADR